MDKSEVKVVVDREMRGALDRFGIGHWKVTVKYEPPSNPAWCASCERDVDYNDATVRLDPDQHDDEAAVVRSLEHELLHIALAPFDLYREAMTQHIPNGTTEAKQEARLHAFAVEQTVINLERIVRGLRREQRPAADQETA